jgi:2-(1,2-epoxy-1,2-dihydrophenyl)acetyl-CoA isomerase
MGKNVLYEKKDAVAKIILNRPEAFNALNEEMGKDLASAIEDCFDSSVRAVVITGAGRAFCSGGDLKAMQTMDTAQLSRFLADLTKTAPPHYHRYTAAAKTCIAAVNGPWAEPASALPWPVTCALPWRARVLNRPTPVPGWCLMAASQPSCPP